MCSIFLFFKNVLINYHFGPPPPPTSDSACMNNISTHRMDIIYLVLNILTDAGAQINIKTALNRPENAGLSRHITSKLISEPPSGQNIHCNYISEMITRTLILKVMFNTKYCK